MLGHLKWQGPSKELVTQLEEKGVKRDQVKHVFFRYFRPPSPFEQEMS